jgi:hypothetical protein
MNNGIATAASKERIEIVWGGRKAVAELRRTNRRFLRIDIEPSGHIVAFAPPMPNRRKSVSAWGARLPGFFEKSTA